MTNLTEKQQLIIESLVAEFTNINESFVKTSGNIFAHLCDDVDNDKKRIKELEALDVLGKTKIAQQIHDDFDKYNGMFDEVGIELKRVYEHDNINDWELVTKRKDKYGMGYHVRDYQGYNPLKWSYRSNNSEYKILGKYISCVDGHHVESYLAYGKKYKTVEDFFEIPIFKEYLKQLINIA
jgi:hypothetical protein